MHDNHALPNGGMSGRSLVSNKEAGLYSVFITRLYERGDNVFGGIEVFPRRIVLEVLAHWARYNKGPSTSALARKLAVPLENMRRTVKALEEEGQLKRVGTYAWSVCISNEQSEAMNEAIDDLIETADLIKAYQKRG